MRLLKNRVIKEARTVISSFLQRELMLDYYYTPDCLNGLPEDILLVNDGQNLEEVALSNTLQLLYTGQIISRLLCVGIHAGGERMQEYGTAFAPDYAGRGASAYLHEGFVMEELMPGFLHEFPGVKTFGYAGFSLGGLSALDMVLRNPNVFCTAGVFSGSLWWRSKPLGAGYDDDRDRIMLNRIRKCDYHPGLRFYFTTGSLDETADRNNNGIIDSIDDTVAVIEALTNNGYKIGDEIEYINYHDGKHDMETWGRALPGFLHWAYGFKRENRKV